MIQLKTLVVSDQFGLDFLNISFSLADTSEDITEYQFDLLRSNNDKEAFVVIAKDIKNFKFVDSDVNLYRIDLKYYYKVQITNKVNSEILFSDISEFTTNEPDSYASALISMYDLYLETAINNNPVRLLKKKRSGEICSCFDEVRNRAKTTRCEICFGTKYVGGYYSAEELRISYFNSPSIVQKFDAANVADDESPIQAWASNYPLIQNDDILVDKNNSRYVISSYQPTYKNFYLLKQTFQMQRLHRSNIAYKMPII